MPDYYDGWETETFGCSKCGWSGKGAECQQGEMFRELYELDCPNCCTTLTVITYPTIEESRANWDKVDEADKLMIEAHEQFIQKAQNSMLQSPEELPDLEGDVIVLVWDHLHAENNTVIRYGKKIVWREPAFYEGYVRFEEVAEILKRKYGDRLKDLAPAQRSLNYLWGDVWSASRQVDEFRDQVGNIIEATNGEIDDNSHKLTFEESERVQRSLGLKRLQLTKQIPQIESDDNILLVWDEEDIQGFKHFLVRYGNEIIWKEVSYFGCYERFEKIGQILQHKYHSRLKDLIPTRISSFNLYGNEKEAETIVNITQGNIWMNKYELTAKSSTLEQVSEYKYQKLSERERLESRKRGISSQLEAEKNKMKYTLFVDDNFHYMDESKRYKHSEYASCEDATKTAKKIIDEFLISNYKPGLTEFELYENYKNFGEDTFIVSDEKNCDFSAWTYAKERCYQICSHYFDENFYEQIRPILEKAITFCAKEEINNNEKTLNNLMSALEEFCSMSPTEIYELKPYILHFMRNEFQDYKFRVMVQLQKIRGVKSEISPKVEQIDLFADGELIGLGAEAAIYYIESGSRRFEDFARSMVADFGNAIKPYLKSFYGAALDYPSFDSTGMNENYRKINIDSILVETNNTLSSD